MNSLKSTCEEYINSNNDSNHVKLVIKLIGLINTNDKLQREVFINLSDKGINKIIKNFQNENEEIRKISLRFILSLLGNNEVLQNIFCEKYDFNLIGNVICINWFPKVLKEIVSIDAKLICELKSSVNNVTMQNKFWIWPMNIKYTIDSLPDPNKYLIGIIHSCSFSNTKILQEYESLYDIRLLNNKLELAEERKDNLTSNNKLIKNISAGSGSESATKLNVIKQTDNKDKIDNKTINSIKTKPNHRKINSFATIKKTKI
jgi:hypothetical protein